MKVLHARVSGVQVPRYRRYQITSIGSSPAYGMIPLKQYHSTGQYRAATKNNRFALPLASPSTCGDPMEAMDRWQPVGSESGVSGSGSVLLDLVPRGFYVSPGLLGVLLCVDGQSHLVSGDRLRRAC